MKLHLPKLLRNAVLACITAVAGIATTTVGTATFAGGVVAFAISQQQALAETAAIATTIATMKQLADAGTLGTGVVVRQDSRGMVCTFTGQGAITNITNAGVLDAITSSGAVGGKYVTIAAWLKPDAKAVQSIFGYGAQGDGLKFDLTAGGTELVTKDKVATTQNRAYSAGEWQLVAVTFKLDQQGNDRFLYTPTDGQYYSNINVGSTGMNTPAEANQVFAIGSGNGTGLREAFSGKIGNLSIITSDNVLNNSDIANIIGSTAPVAIGGFYWKGSNEDNAITATANWKTYDGDAVTSLDNALLVFDGATTEEVATTVNVGSAATVGEMVVVAGAKTYTFNVNADLTVNGGEIANNARFTIAENAVLKFVDTIVNTTHSQPMGGAGKVQVGAGAVLSVNHSSASSSVRSAIEVLGGGTLKLTQADSMGWGATTRMGDVLLRGGSESSVAKMQVTEKQTMETNVNLGGNALVTGGQLEFYGGKITATGTNNTIESEIYSRYEQLGNVTHVIEVTNAADTLNIAGRVHDRGGNAGNNAIAKKGAGTLTFSGANNILYKGFKAEGGIVNFNNTTRVQAGALTVSEGATVNVNSALTITHAISNSGSITVGQGGSIILDDALVVQNQQEGYVNGAFETSENGFRGAASVTVMSGSVIPGLAFTYAGREYTSASDGSISNVIDFRTLHVVTGTAYMGGALDTIKSTSTHADTIAMSGGNLVVADDCTAGNVNFTVNGATLDATDGSATDGSATDGSLSVAGSVVVEALNTTMKGNITINGNDDANRGLRLTGTGGYDEATGTFTTPNLTITGEGTVVSTYRLNLGDADSKETRLDITAGALVNVNGTSWNGNNQDSFLLANLSNARGEVNIENATLNILNSGFTVVDNAVKSAVLNIKDGGILNIAALSRRGGASSDKATVQLEAGGTINIGAYGIGRHAVDGTGTNGDFTFNINGGKLGILSSADSWATYKALNLNGDLTINTDKYDALNAQYTGSGANIALHGAVTTGEHSLIKDGEGTLILGAEVMKDSNLVVNKGAITLADGATSLKIHSLSVNDGVIGVIRLNAGQSLTLEAAPKGNICFVLDGITFEEGVNTKVITVADGDYKPATAVVECLTAENVSATYADGVVTLTKSETPLVAGDLKWKTDGSTNEWSSSTIQNWKAGDAATRFVDGSTVTFGDSSTSQGEKVSIQGTVTTAGMTVNGKGWQFGGTGSIAGAGGLSLAEGASLTVSTANSYTGGTTIGAGAELTITKKLALGGSDAKLGNVSGTGTLVIDLADGQTVNATGTGDSASLNGFTGTVEVRRGKLQVGENRGNKGGTDATFDVQKVIVHDGATLITHFGRSTNNNVKIQKDLYTNLDLMSGSTVYNIDGHVTYNASKDDETYKIRFNIIDPSASGDAARYNEKGVVKFDQYWQKIITFDALLEGDGIVQFANAENEATAEYTFNNNGNTFRGTYETIDDNGTGTDKVIGLKLCAENAAKNADIKLSSTQAKSYVYLMANAAVNGLYGVVDNENAVLASGGARTLTVQKGDFGGRMDDNGNGNTLSLTKTGTDTLTLRGTMAYTGATTVTGGTLEYAGTGALTLGSISTVASAQIITASALTLAANAALTMDMAGATTANALISVGAGQFALTSDTCALTLSNTSGLEEGTYTLLSWAETNENLTLDKFVVSGVKLGRSTGYSLALADNALVLTKSQPVSNSLHWIKGSGTWSEGSELDTDGAAGGATLAFYNEDKVTFGQLASDATVTISGTTAAPLTAVAVTVDAGTGKTYTFAADSGEGVNGQLTTSTLTVTSGTAKFNDGALNISALETVTVDGTLDLAANAHSAFLKLAAVTTGDGTVKLAGVDGFGDTSEVRLAGMTESSITTAVNFEISKDVAIHAGGNDKTLIIAKGFAVGDELRMESSGKVKVVDGGNLTANTISLGHTTQGNPGHLEITGGKVTVGTLVSTDNDTFATSANTFKMSGGTLELTTDGAEVKNFQSTITGGTLQTGDINWGISGATIGGATIANIQVDNTETTDVADDTRAGTGFITLENATLTSGLTVTGNAQFKGAITLAKGYTPTATKASHFVKADGTTSTSGYKVVDDVYSLSALGEDGAKLSTGTMREFQDASTEAADTTWSVVVTENGVDQTITDGVFNGTDKTVTFARQHTTEYWVCADTDTTTADVVYASTNTDEFGNATALVLDGGALKLTTALDGALVAEGGSGIMLNSSGTIEIYDATPTDENKVVLQASQISRVTGNTTATATLTGNGVYDLGAGSTSLGAGVSLSDSAWTGTVKLSNINGVDGGLNIGNYGNENSTVALVGVTAGIHEDVNTNVLLEKTDTLNGLAISSCSTASYTFGKAVSGSGDMQIAYVNDSTGVGTYKFTGSTSEWSGGFVVLAPEGSTNTNTVDVEFTAGGDLFAASGAKGIELNRGGVMNVTIGNTTTATKMRGGIANTAGGTINLTTEGTTTLAGALSNTGTGVFNLTNNGTLSLANDITLGTLVNSGKLTATCQTLTVTDALTLGSDKAAGSLTVTGAMNVTKIGVQNLKSSLTAGSLTSTALKISITEALLSDLLATEGKSMPLLTLTADDAAIDTSILTVNGNAYGDEVISVNRQFSYFLDWDATNKVLTLQTKLNGTPWNDATGTRWNDATLVAEDFKDNKIPDSGFGKATDANTNAVIDTLAENEVMVNGAVEAMNLTVDRWDPVALNLSIIAGTDTDPALEVEDSITIHKDMNVSGNRDLIIGNLTASETVEALALNVYENLNIREGVGLMLAENATLTVGKLAVADDPATLEDETAAAIAGNLKVQGTLANLGNVDVYGNVIIAESANLHSGELGAIYHTVGANESSIDISGTVTNAGNLVNAGKGKLTIGAEDTTAGTTSLVNTGSVVVSGGTVTVKGSMANGETADGQATGGSLTIGGTGETTAEVEVTGNLSNNAGGSISIGSAAIEDDPSTEDLNETAAATVGSLVVGGKLDNNGSSLSIVGAKSSLTVGTETTPADLTNVGGRITIDKGATVTVNGALDNTNGGVAGATGGRITIDENATVTVDGALNNTSGGIAIGTAATDTAAATTGSLTVGGALDNTSGSISIVGAESSLTVGTTADNADLTNVGGSITIDEGATVTVNGELDNTNGGVAGAAGGRITIDENATVTVDGALNNTSGSITIDGGSSLTVGTTADNADLTNTGGSITIGTAATDTAAATTGSLTVNGNLKNYGDGNLTVQGEGSTVKVTGNLTLSVLETDTNGNEVVASKGSLTVGEGTELTADGNLVANKIDLGIDGSITVGGAATANKVTIAEGGSFMASSATITGTLDNDGTLSVGKYEEDADGNLVLNGNGSSLDIGTLIGTGDVHVGVGGELTIGSSTEFTGVLDNQGSIVVKPTVDAEGNKASFTLSEATDKGGDISAPVVVIGGQMKEVINPETNQPEQVYESANGTVVDVLITDKLVFDSLDSSKGTVLTANQLESLTKTPVLDDAGNPKVDATTGEPVVENNKITIVLSEVEDSEAVAGVTQLLEIKDGMEAGKSLAENFDLSRYGYDEDGVYDASSEAVQKDYMQKLLGDGLIVRFSDTEPTQGVSMAALGGQTGLWVNIDEQTEPEATWTVAVDDGQGGTQLVYNDKTKAGLDIGTVTDGTVKLLKNSILDNVLCVDVTKDIAIDLTGNAPDELDDQGNLANVVAVNIRGLKGDKNLTIRGERSADNPDADVVNIKVASDGYDGQLVLNKVNATVQGSAANKPAEVKGGIWLITDTFADLNVTNTVVDATDGGVELDGNMVNGSLKLDIGEKLAFQSGSKAPLAADSELEIKGTGLDIAYNDKGATTMDMTGVSKTGQVLVNMSKMTGSAGDIVIGKDGVQSALLDKYFSGIRFDANKHAVVADRNTSYYSDLVSDMAVTSNGMAGMALADAALLNLNPQVEMQGGGLATMLDAIEKAAADGSTDELDHLGAALAGASSAVLGMAAHGDLDRQLQAIRNRTTTMGVDQSMVHPEIPYFNAWINAEGDYRELSDNGTEGGYKLSSWGGTVGFDVDCSPTVTAGLAFTAMYGDLTVTGADDANGDFDTYYLSAFARYCASAWTHTFVATLGTTDFAMERTVMDSKQEYTTSGTSFGLMYELGRVYALDEDATSCIQPVFNITWRHTSVDGYQEDGNDLALEVDSQTLNTVTLGLGARVQAIVGENMYNRASIFECRLFAKADIGDRRSSTEVNLAGGTAEIESAEVGALGLEAGAGLTIPLGDGGSSLFMDASVELRADYTNVNGTVGYRVNF